MCFFLTPITGDVSINCGSTAVSEAHGGRKWVGDGNPNSRSSLRLKGKSTISSTDSISDHQIPYNTARISRSTFSYTFRLDPGQKFIRLHFYPTAYKGFERWKDLFNVVAGPFTLLGNFSASLTGDALGLRYFTKEYCLNVEENQLLGIIFSPATGESKDAYAFVNGIEIVPVTLGHSCFHGGGIGVRVIGHESRLLYIDNGTVLEMVHREKFGWDSASSGDDLGDIFRTKKTVSKKKAGKKTWKILVDVGFRYLLRLRFSNRGLKMMENGPQVFKVLISEVVACVNVDIFQERDHFVFLKHDHMDFIVLMRGRKEEGKRHLSLQSCDAFNDGHGLFTGFDMFKLSNFDNSLAIPNPLPCTRGLPLWIIQSLLSVIAHRNPITTVTIIIVSLVNVIVYKLRGILESNNTEEVIEPSDRANGFCRQFSLSEIRLGTGYFSPAHLIGRGGFGMVYKCIIDNGSKSVAIKRSKSRQGAREFLTEIETLSELRHVNLVSLIGYCNEQKEMILVYDYMPNGTLADHLYNLERNGTSCSSLTWKQRLNICIGAGRGLDYLHTGNGVYVIHRDVKASNILLDENFTAKVSDFGLVKHGNTHNPQSHVSTKVKGTPGYFDPNYYRTGKLTTKSDVYSFGVVLLEVLRGRPALDRSDSMEDRILTKLARDEISEGEEELIVASSLRGQILLDSLKPFVQVVERCLDDEPKKRPTMAEVVRRLEFALARQESNDESMSVDSGQLNLNMDNRYPSSGANRRKAPAYKSFWQQWDAFFNRLKSPELSVPGAKLTQFDMNTIAVAIEQFSPMYKIGQGVSGSVYKAKLLSGQIAAVKRIATFCEFENEILLLQNLRHRNIVKLLGYCIHGEERMLVYEFMENGALDSLIFDEVRRTQLQWNQRFKIIMGIAQGLLYLHRDSGSRIIHRNPKPSNILLDSEMQPKISGFGLARSLGGYQSHERTPEAGINGYLSPESMNRGVFSTASDLYTFGVTVLEIVSGKSNGQDGECCPIVDIAHSLSDDEERMDLVDKSIQDANMDEAQRCITVGIFCTSEECHRRPPELSVVLEILEG